MAGLIVAVPFFFMGVKRMSLNWSAPGLVSIAGTKYYSVQVFNRMMKEDAAVDDYWKKSKKFQSDLNKVDRYVKACKAAL